jgi:hypothetical protein
MIPVSSHVGGLVKCALPLTMILPLSRCSLLLALPLKSIDFAWQALSHVREKRISPLKH